MTVPAPLVPHTQWELALTEGPSTLLLSGLGSNLGQDYRLAYVRPEATAAVARAQHTGTGKGWQAATLYEYYSCRRLVLYCTCVHSCTAVALFNARLADRAYYY